MATDLTATIGIFLLRLWGYAAPKVRKMDAWRNVPGRGWY